MNETTNTKNRLIQVAKELFASQGYDNTSVREITNRAEANLGAVTYHFGSKENLYHAVLASLAKPFFERLHAIPGQRGAPMERIQAFVRTYFEYMSANRELPCLVMQQVSLNRPVPEPIRPIMQRAIPSLAAIIREGQENGSIVHGDPMLLALSVVVLPVNAAIQQPLLQGVFGIDISKPADHKKMMEYIVEFTRRSLTSTGRDT